MVAPLAPTILVPQSGYRYDTGGVDFNCKFVVNTPEIGAVVDSFAIRRKLMPSGSFEYYTVGAGTWGGTEVFNSITAVANGTTVSQLPLGMGTGNKTWQWSVATKAGANAGPYAKDIYWFQTTTGIVALSLAGPSGTVTNSRPTISWFFTTGTAGGRQKSYRVAIYSAAAYGAGGFDPTTAASQATATWIMPAHVIDSQAFSVVPDVDLTSGVTYKAWIEIIDDYNQRTAQLLSATWTMSLGLPPAPTMVMTARPTLGAVDVAITSAFNMLEADTSAFITGTGTWQVLQLAAISRVATDGGAMKYEAGGITFSALDALHASFTAQDTAYASFDAERAVMSGGNPIITTPTGLGGYAVLPSTVYSFTSQIKNSSGTGSHRILMKWYQSSGAASAITPTSTGTSIACNASTYTEVHLKSVTSPADAAFLAIQIESISEAYPVYALVQSAALAKAADVFWTGGGSSASVKFILERKVGSGSYKPVWGASRTNPVAPPNPVLSTVTIRDRGYPIGRTDVVYRSYAVSLATGAAVYSLPSVASGPSLVAEAWLRDPTDSAGATDVAVMLSSWDRSVVVKSEEYLPDGGTASVVLHGGIPNSQKITLETYAFDLATYEKIMALLTSKKTLHLQRAIGGECWFVRVTSDIKTPQTLAAPLSSEVTAARHFHKVSCELTVIADREVTGASLV